MKLLTILVLGLATSLGVSQDKWFVAESAITRLSPAVFSRLPRNIVQYLQNRGCTVPQTHWSREPHNVISGEFARLGQTDWAVLCSRNGESSILVFWSSSTKSVSAVAKAPDRAFLQQISGDGKIGFSRSIEAVGKDYILSQNKAHGGPRPPRITHQAINDAFIEKASVVRYYHRRKWLALQGAD